MTLTDTPGQAFDKVSLNLYQRQSQEIPNVLTTQDLTIYSIAVVLQNPSARDTANAFINAFICKFGEPKEILTNQGSNFMNPLHSQTV